MSNVIQTLIHDALAARKAGEKVKATLLVTLNAEIAKVGKDNGNRDTSEEEALKTIRKFLTGIEDSLNLITDPARRETLVAEQEILQAYLKAYAPVLMSESELAAVIKTIVAGIETKSPKAMGEVMGKLKAQYAGKYDGAMAGAMVKAALA